MIKITPNNKAMAYRLIIELSKNRLIGTALLGDLEYKLISILIEIALFGQHLGSFRNINRSGINTPFGPAVILEIGTMDKDYVTTYKKSGYIG